MVVLTRLLKFLAEIYGQEKVAEGCTSQIHY